MRTQVRWPDISTLGRSVKQHLPRKLIDSEQKGAEPDKEQQPVSARTRSHGTPEEVLDGPVSSRTRSHNAGAAILAVTGGTPDGKDTPGDDDMRTQSLDGLVASRTRRHDPKPDAAPQLMAVDTPAEDDDTIDSDDSSSADNSRPEDPLVLHKSDSGITRHLKTNSECLSTLAKTDNLASFFTIMARARNDIHLAVLEAIFIASYQPVLCSQKDHVRCLTLF